MRPPACTKPAVFLPPMDASSQSYDDLLSPNDNKGKLNLQNQPDPPLSVLQKSRLLAVLIRTHSPVVLHTGAGLSTSAGIRDFRGPDGVWTRKAGLGRDTCSEAGGGVKPSCFEEAAPTLAHVAITALYQHGYIRCVVSQNVDGLHLRAGLPRSALAELHGNLFVDWCERCGKEFERESETRSVGFQPVGRVCVECGGVLTDKALDWEDELPQGDLEMSRREAKGAGLNVVVGSSMQMDPARGLPLRGGKMVLVNLSETEFDGRSWMTVRARGDLVFAVICDELGVKIGRYQRWREIVVRRKEGQVSVGVMMDGEERRKVVGGVRRVRYCAEGKWVEGVGAGYVRKVGMGRVVVRVEAEMGAEELEVKEGCAVRRRMCLQWRDYDAIGREEVDRLEEEARLWRRNKRRRGQMGDWEPRKWFTRGSKRGWQDCVNCRQAVWTGRGKREGHARKCVVTSGNGVRTESEAGGGRGRGLGQEPSGALIGCEDC